MKTYAGAIISVEDVLAGFNTGARREIMVNALIKYGKSNHKISGSELDNLWNDKDGAVTLAHYLGDGFWGSFEANVPGILRPGQISVPEGAKEFVRSLPYPNVAFIFNSPRGVHQVVFKELRVPEEEISYVGWNHCSGSEDISARRPLRVMIEEAVDSMKVKVLPSDVVYVDKGTEMGFAYAKGLHTDYFAIDLRHRRGTKTKFVFQNLVTSFEDFKEMVAFFNVKDYLHRLEEFREVLAKLRGGLGKKNPSRKDHKDRDRH